MKSYLSKYINLFFLFFLICLSDSCKKQDDFLNAVPNQSLAVPSTITDCMSLLSNETVFNGYCDPALGYLSTDDFYVLTTDWQSDVPVGRNTYIFAKDIYDGTLNYSDWSQPYLQVYYANTVLDVLRTIPANASNQKQYDNAKGIALYYRSYAFYNLLQTYALPYDSVSSATDPGIPLRLSADINQKEIRSTVSQCYHQIITDLTNSLVLLPANPSKITQPSQWTVNGLLARVYLAISDFNNAFKYADACLSQNNTLTDYNTLNPGTFTINDNYLSEDIYHTSLNGYFIGGTRAKVDSNLYNSYQVNDLRKSVFFGVNPYSGNLIFRGTYDVFYGNTYSGIATDEIYLIRSECNARLGRAADAINDLNALLVKRWQAGTYSPYTLSVGTDALDLILAERRKELVFRGILRWTDLRRLNKDPNRQVTVSHIINGINYQLTPNDPRYAMPIPDQEVQLTGIPQNPR